MAPMPMDFAPKVMPGAVPQDATFSDAPVMAYVSLNDAAFNFGHALFDFLFPVFNTLQMLDVYHPDFQLLLAKHQVSYSLLPCPALPCPALPCKLDCAPSILTCAGPCPKLRVLWWRASKKSWCLTHHSFVCLPVGASPACSLKLFLKWLAHVLLAACSLMPCHTTKAHVIRSGFHTWFILCMHA